MSEPAEVILWDGPYGVAVTSVAPGITATMIEIGRQSVPVGLPFWVVKIVDLPDDGTMPEEWVIADIVGGRAADGVGEGSPVSEALQETGSA